MSAPLYKRSAAFHRAITSSPTPLCRPKLNEGFKFASGDAVLHFLIDQRSNADLKMKVTSFVLTCACITAALLVGSATEASAKGKKLPDMSASALKGACAKSGAAYGPSDGGGGVCMFGSGDYVICDKNNHCKGYTAKAVLPTSKNDDAIATTGNAQQKGNYDLSAGNAEPKTSIDPGAGVKAEVLGSATASAKFGS